MKINNSFAFNKFGNKFLCACKIFWKKKICLWIQATSCPKMFICQCMIMCPWVQVSQNTNIHTILLLLVNNEWGLFCDCVINVRFFKIQHYFFCSKVIHFKCIRCAFKLLVFDNQREIFREIHFSALGSSFSCFTIKDYLNSLYPSLARYWEN